MLSAGNKSVVFTLIFAIFGYESVYFADFGLYLQILQHYPHRLTIMNITSRMLASAIACIGLSAAAATTVEIDLGKKGAPVSPTMYGLFFEDINYAADGGLYAEKIKNRSFEFPQPFTGWTVAGNVELLDNGPFERNPHIARLKPAGHPHKHTALENEGYFGVSFEKDAQYRFSVWARAVDSPAKIRVELVDPAADGETQVMSRQEITVAPGEWKKYTAILTSTATVEKGRLRIFLCRPEAEVDVEHISLMPVDTWKGRENGLRKDLAQALYDTHPGVFRFPGGCIVEGTDLATRYQWKNTVGPVENRPLNENRWHYTFPHRFYPDYYQSGGLGFFEFFQLCEDMGASPLPVVNVGLACQYQNNADSCHVPVTALQPYIDDALDLIEFANGDTTTVWGKLRAYMGHAAPFGLKYIGIGNEQWGEEFTMRLEPFVKAIRKAYPDIKIVGSSGPSPDGKEFDYLWGEMTRLGADLVDEHFYRPESWFISSADRYDSYSRKGPKVFAGEYACHGAGKKRNHFNAALLEAAFMTGLERNADIVEMATYAPLFAHVEGWQWRPDMIWYDNLRSVRTASYHVQKLYSDNKGTHTALLTVGGKPATGGDTGLYASAVRDSRDGSYIVKAVNITDTPIDLNLKVKGLKKGVMPDSVTVTTLHADDDAENTLDNPHAVMPVTERMAIDNAADWTTVLPAKTFAIYRFSKK